MDLLSFFKRKLCDGSLPNLHHLPTGTPSQVITCANLHPNCKVITGLLSRDCLKYKHEQG